MAASETASESERQTKPADAVNPAMGKMAAAQIPDPSASIAERSSTSATAKEAVSQTKADANAGQQTAEPEEPALTATEDAEQTDAETTTVAALTMSSRSDSNDIIMEAPSEVTAGSAFNVKWDGSAEAWDYITTVEANASEGSYSQYAYTKDGKLLTLQAPQIPGDYEIRYVEGATQNTLTRLLITVR
jgi:hypothetical protein